MRGSGSPAPRPLEGPGGTSKKYAERRPSECELHICAYLACTVAAHVFDGVRPHPGSRVFANARLLLSGTINATETLLCNVDLLDQDVLGFVTMLLPHRNLLLELFLLFLDVV